MPSHFCCASFAFATGIGRTKSDSTSRPRENRIVAPLAEMTSPFASFFRSTSLKFENETISATGSAISGETAAAAKRRIKREMEVRIFGWDMMLFAAAPR
jgi:hypothetical protein